MLELLERDRTPLAVLENAANVHMSDVLNKPGECIVSFDLPYNDPKLKECHSYRFIKMYDPKKVGWFDPYRIMPRTIEHSAKGNASIECMHCITTLSDDLLVGYHEIGGLGYYTRQALEYVLSKQTVKHWTLGVCEFNHQFQYGWEDENLLQALYSIPNCFADDYQFTFDTTVYPWVINLIRLDRTGIPKSRFVYNYNINSVRKEEDTTELCNRLYCRGYGEGINQLTIASVNGGRDYIEDVASQAKYGIITRAWTDRRFEYADTLLARGQTLLKSYSKPRLSYSLDAVDLFPITNNPIDKPNVGDITRIEDDALEEKAYQSIIVSVKRQDVYGAKPTVQIEVENTKADLAETISDQSNRLRVEENYAQGATNIWAIPFAENADPAHPIVVEVFIPADTKIVNRVNLRWRAENFRADVQGAAAGGGMTSTTGTQPAQTSSAGGGLYASTGAGGGSYMSAGASTVATTGGTHYGFAIYQNTGYITQGSAGSNHTHDIYTTVVNIEDAIRHHGHSMEHTHYVTMQDHDHSINIEAHTHTLPSHNHSIVLPTHVHAQIYGIYEGSRASNATIRIGDYTFSAPQNTDFDLVPYLEKDDEGRIKRGVSHIIQIIPNGLTRLAGNITPQVFIQSRGGGNF